MASKNKTNQRRKKRNIYARLVRTELFRQRIVTSKKLYNRKRANDLES